MPLYELFCLAKPALERPAMAEMLKTAGKAIFQNQGVITDIKSFGDTPLAYEIRKPGGKFQQAHMWQMTFMVKPSALEEVEHNLKVDERVLRYLVQRKAALPRLPNSFSISRRSQHILESN